MCADDASGVIVPLPLYSGYGAPIECVDLPACPCSEQRCKKILFWGRVSSGASLLVGILFLANGRDDETLRFVGGLFCIGVLMFALSLMFPCRGRSERRLLDDDEDEDTPEVEMIQVTRPENEQLYDIGITLQSLLSERIRLDASVEEGKMTRE
jgi:hypothetical protein